MEKVITCARREDGPPLTFVTIWTFLVLTRMKAKADRRYAPPRPATAHGSTGGLVDIAQEAKHDAHFMKPALVCEQVTVRVYVRACFVLGAAARRQGLNKPLCVSSTPCVHARRQR